MALKRKRVHETTALLKHLNIQQWRGAAVEQRPFFESQKCFLSVDEEDRFDADVTILDYMVFDSLNCLIDARQKEINRREAPIKEATRKLEQCHAWLEVMEPGLSKQSKLPENVSYRLRIHQFVSIFTHRQRTSLIGESALKRLRERNTTRLSRWKKFRPDATLSSPAESKISPLEYTKRRQYRKSLEKHLLTEMKDAKTGNVKSSIKDTYASLRDMLPLFLDLIVAREYKFDAEDISQVMLEEPMLKLVGMWMLQATVESYLLLGAQGSEPLNEIFALGSLGANFPLDAPRDTIQVLNLFCADKNMQEESPTWTEMRDRFAKRASGLLEASPQHGMHIASEQYPVHDFELEVLAWLTSLHEELPKPDLQQVLEGNIEGLNQTETQDMLGRIFRNPKAETVPSFLSPLA